MDHQSISYNLISAVREGRLERTRQLINSFGLSYSQAWSEGYILLRDALENKHTEVAKLLLAYGSKVNSKNKKKPNTPLHFAVLNGDIEIVKMLLDRGANVKARAKGKKADIFSQPYIRKKYTPLHLAVETGSKEIINLLLSKGANVDAKGDDGITPLHIAAERGYLQIVQDLLKHGAYVDAAYTSTSWIGHTPLHVAVVYGSREMVKLLLSKGANVNAEAECGLTALHIASRKGHKNIVKLLLKYGAKVDSEDDRGATSLHYAADEGHLDFIKILLKFDASINFEDEDGLTALHYASIGGYVEIVKTLLEHGADINVSTYNDETPLDYAISGINSYYKNWNFSSWDSSDDDTSHHTSRCTCNRLQDYENITVIFKRHIIKLISANLYVSYKNFTTSLTKCEWDELSMNSDNSFDSNDEIGDKDFQNECKEEIASMKSKKVNNTNVSFYDILKKKDINQLAIYAGNENILQVLRSNDYKIKFPIYASMISSRFKEGEKRRELLQQSNKIFDFFRQNFGLPQTCTAKIFSYLSNEDIRILMDTY